MRNDEPKDELRNELLERLKSLEISQSSSNMADLAYGRAREALERAMEEARNVRLQAIDDARQTRERELSSLMESMRSLRQSAEVQVSQLLRSAEIEAERTRDNAETHAHQVIERASQESAQIKSEAAVIRSAAEERVREVDRMETEFNAMVEQMALRLGIVAKPPEGWFKRLTGSSNK